MLHWVRNFIAGLGTVSVAVWPVFATAETWLMIEARDVPSNCAHPVDCIADSRLAARNVMSLSAADRETFILSLNSAATIRGVIDEPVVALYNDRPLELHALPVAEKLVPLIDHPGVLFDPTSLDGHEDTVGFADKIRTALEQAGLRFLTKEEWENTPGRPVLSVRYSAIKESAGCIIPYSVSMSIKEEVVLARNPNLKLTTNTWAGTGRQNLANTNFQPANALNDVLGNFVADYTKANAPT